MSSNLDWQTITAFLALLGSLAYNLSQHITSRAKVTIETEEVHGNSFREEINILMSAYKGLLDDLSNQVERFKKENAELTKNVAALTDRLADLEKENADLTRKIAELDRKSPKA